MAALADTVGVGVPVLVCVGVGDGVPVDVGEEEGVCEGVTVAVGVTDGSAAISGHGKPTRQVVLVYPCNAA